MKAIYIEENAVRFIAQYRSLQSGEFEDASSFIDFLRNGEELHIQNLCCKLYKNIAYIYNTSRFVGQKFILFDIEKYDDLLSKDDNFLITIFQKIIKFSLKQWEVYPLNVTEKIINNNHAILFPFPYTDKNPYKILLSLSPNMEYTERRRLKCVYVVNMGNGQFSTTDYSILNIKAINQDAKRVCTIESAIEKNENGIAPLQVSCLPNVITKEKSVFLSYEKWMPYLSKAQQQFVQRSCVGSERLEGAAGTGKTLSLILRSLYLCIEAQKKNVPLKILFLCHSISSRNGLKLKIESISPIPNILTSECSPQSIELTTLQEWCTTYLGNSIGQAELLDADAQECKELQYRFIADTFSECKKRDYPTYKHLCSENFQKFLEEENLSIIIDLIESEISITIKGRASGDLETYKKLPRLEGSLPLCNEGDFNFVYLIYEKYQDMLIELGYFDNDDISLSSALQLASPIWKRRRANLGYDILVIDEVHLFSYNELAIFHFLSKNEKDNRIIYAVDKTQAVGDRGLTKEILNESLQIVSHDEISYKTVFRSSPQIIDLAFSILTSGADMFLNFENPLDKINYSFTDSEERKSIFPKYVLLPTDELMIEYAFKEVDQLTKQLNIKRDSILLVSVDMEIHKKLSQYIKDRNKPCEFLQRRGDYNTIIQAQQKNRYVLGFIDYIGGLEFDAVIIIGVDKSRVPQYSNDERIIYQNYEWHNRMYVATTRAKYTVVIIGNKSCQPSTLLQNAIDNGRLNLIDDISD